MARTHTTQMPEPVAAYYEKRFLMRSEENFVFEGLGTPGRIPANEGKTVVWNRMTNPSAKTALSESFDPTPAGLSATLISATVAQYGNFEQVSDLLETTAIDTLVKEVIDVLAYEAALSIDTVIANVLTAGGTSQIQGSIVARNSLVAANKIEVSDIRKALRTLHKFAAQPHTKGKYVAATHPDVIYDLQGDTNWVNAHIYTEKGIDAVYNGEAGELYGTRFVMTQNSPVLSAAGCSTGAVSANVYQTHIMGKDFFGVSKLQNLTTYVDSPSPRSALRLYSDIGWKASFAVKVLNDSFAVRLETGATDGTA
jgi:N4-gp56 family major capsid protein